MAETVRITTEAGRLADEAECYWRNDVLAVTRDLGRQKASGVEVPPSEGCWTITHLRTGYCLGLDNQRDPDIVRALAEHLTPVIPWATISLRSLRQNLDVRTKVQDAAREFWASRAQGEG